MFTFTTTHVINSNLDLTTGKPLFVLGTDASGKKVLQVKGVNNFKSANVEKIYKAPSVEPENAEVEIDFSKVPAAVKKGDTLRLSIYIRLTLADQSSYYANDTQFKGRPFTIEIPWLGSAAATLTNAKKIIKKYGLLVFEKEVVTPTVSGTKLVLTATNEFQRFHTVKLEYYVDSKEPFAEIWEEVEEAVEVTKEGKEGFGTYGYILRNIKLPTTANTEAFAPMQNEAPIPGAHYTLFTIHYCVNRGPLGLNAVGDTVKSVTTSVFYVNDALLGAEDATAKTDFEVALKTLATDAGADVWEEVPSEEEHRD